MIYLIEDQNYLKIGYAKEISSRFKAYKTHAAAVKLLASKMGCRADEKELHKLCADYRYRGEWFENRQEVKDIFNNYESKITKDWELIEYGIEEHYKWVKRVINGEAAYRVRYGNTKEYEEWNRKRFMAERINEYANMIKKEDKQNLPNNALEYLECFENQKAALQFFLEHRGLNIASKTFKVLPDTEVTVTCYPEAHEIFQSCFTKSGEFNPDKGIALLEKFLNNEIIPESEKLKMMYMIQVNLIKIIVKMQNAFSHTLDSLEGITNVLKTTKTE